MTLSFDNNIDPKLDLLDDLVEADILDSSSDDESEAPKGKTKPPKKSPKKDKTSVSNENGSDKVGKPTPQKSTGNSPSLSEQDVSEKMVQAANGGSFSQMIIDCVDATKQCDLPAVVQWIISAYQDRLSSSEQLSFRDELSVYHLQLMGLTLSKGLHKKRDVFQHIWLTTMMQLLSAKNLNTSMGTSKNELSRLKHIEMSSKAIYSAGLKSADQWQDFMNDFKLRIQTYNDWASILIINILPKGVSNRKLAKTFNLITDYNDRVLTPSFINRNDFGVAKDQKWADASTSMYQAIKRSLGARLKEELQIYEEEIGTSGPRLFYYLANYLHQKASEIRVEVTQRLNNLSTELKQKNYDLLTIAPSILKKVLVMRSSGCSLSGFYEIVLSAMLEIDCREFNANVSGFHSSLNAYDKSDDKGTKLLKLLRVVPEYVKEANRLSKWPYTIADSESKKRKAESADLTAFKAEATMLKKKIKALEANNASTSSNRSNNAPKVAKFKRWGVAQNNFGKTGLLPDKDSLVQFIRGHGERKRESVKYNGQVWHWCDKCQFGGKNGRMGSHPTNKHKTYDQKPSGGGSVFQDAPSAAAANVSVFEPVNEEVAQDTISVQSSYDANEYDDN